MSDVGGWRIYKIKNVVEKKKDFEWKRHRKQGGLWLFKYESVFRGNIDEECGRKKKEPAMEWIQFLRCCAESMLRLCLLEY